MKLLKLRRNQNFGFKKIMLTSLMAIFCLSMSVNIYGQTRHTEFLTRGLVAVKSAENVFISWRIFATDNDSVRFNLYRNDTLVNQNPISGISNYVDSTVSADGIYYLETIYDVATKEISTPVSVWNKEYKSISIHLPNESYYPDDISVGDLDGDGELELVVKVHNSNGDVGADGYRDPVYLQAYNMNGKFLWSLNLGVNIRAGNHYTQFMVFDLDGDGKAEVACKTAPGTTDATGEYLSNGPAATDDDAIDYRNGSGVILSGPEYLTVFNGQTGEEVSTVDYYPGRGQDLAAWGDTYGNRSERHMACIAYFDSIPSLVMTRGIYRGDLTGSLRGRTAMGAYDFKDGALVSRWTFNADYTGDYPEYTGQGYHSLSVADVDADGKDEIVYGAMVVDHDGSPKWSSGLGHGDALHCSDIDPERPGLEIWGVHEHAQVGSALLDAKTGEVIWKTGAGDIARGVTADLVAATPGMECWGGTDRLRSAKNELAGDWPSSSNFLSWWDGDLLRELLDGISVSKYGIQDPIFTADDCISGNGTKATPALGGDILGDWREEVIFRTQDSKEIRIYTTTIPTDNGIYTLLQDPQYRLALAWQNVGYNQPPHPGFFLGDGMDPAPTPDIAPHPANDASAIHITSPSNDFVLGLGQDLKVIAHVNGLSDSKQFIVISNGSSVLDTIHSVPHYASISGLTSGNYSLLASAYGLDGNLMTSDTIKITVDEGYPHVSITAPVSGKTYLPADSVEILAKAFDTDGNIDSVAIYLNDARVTGFTSAPFALKIESPGVGVHELKAIAYDNDAKSTESDVVYVEVGLSNLIQETDAGFCSFENGVGWVHSNNVGFTGLGFANTDNVSGVQIVWGIDFPEEGTYKFEWRYAASSARPGNLMLNGDNAGNVAFENTVDWTTWKTISLNVTAPAGITKVVLEATGGSGLPNIDYLRVYSLEASDTVSAVACDSLIPKDIATLSALSVDGVRLTPVFNAATLSYAVELDAGVSEMNINATKTDSMATLVGDGLVSVGTTAGSAEIIVTARDGVTKNIYTINYDFATSIEAISVKGANIYPVPADNYINIKLNTNDETIQSVSIYSMEGRKILTTNEVNSNQTIIDLPDMQSGIYMIRIESNKKTYSSKFNVVKK